MATRKREGISRSAFIRGQLEQNSAIKFTEVEKAWHAAGHRDKLNPTLYYQAKKKMGLTKRRRRRRGAAAPEGQPTTASDYAKIERTLDQLLVATVALKNATLEEAIRAARRIASAKLI